MVNKYCLVIASCDAYSDLWVPFFQLLKKRWPAFDAPIYISTESKKITIEGLDIRCPLNFNKKVTWSHRMLSLLKVIDYPYILLLLDDFWLYDNVKTALIEKCIQYLDSDDNIGNFCLLPQHATYFHNSSEFPEFYLRPKQEPFRITTQATLWRKEYFIKVLRKHENVWFFETRATIRSKFYKERLYVLKPTEVQPFKYHICGVLHQGKYIQKFLDDFSSDNLKLDLTRGVVPTMTLAESGKKVNKVSFFYWWGVFKSVLPRIISNR